MKLGQSIMETTILPFSKIVFLREDTAEAFLGTKASIEERFTSTYTLHHLHRQHIGTKKLKLVSAEAINMLQEMKGLIIAHLLISNICHVVESLSLIVRIT